MILYRIENGSYWLQGSNGWGQREFANVYPSLKAAKKEWPRLNLTDTSARVEEHAEIKGERSWVYP